MDLTIPLIGLFSYIGYSFNKSGKTPRMITGERKELTENENPSGTNIYHSVHLKKIQQDERNRLNKNFEASRVPGSNIISYLSFNDTDESSVFKSIDSQYTGSDYSSQIKSKEFDQKVSKSDLFNAPTYLENLKNGANLGLSGGPIPLTHSNMQAHYRGMVPKNTFVENKGSRNIERLTGVSSLYSGKTEVDNMFQTQQTKFPNVNLVDQERYKPNNKKPFESPFESIKVAPIPGQSMRPIYKNVDELRTQKRETYTNPLNLQKMSRKITADTGEETNEPRKVISGQYFGPANSKYSKQSESGTYDLNRVVQEQEFGNVSVPHSKQNIGMSKNSFGMSRLPLNKEIRERNGDTGHVNIKRKVRVSENFENLAQTERTSTEQETYFPGIKNKQKVVIRSNVDAPTTIKEGNLFSYINNPHKRTRGVTTTDSFKNMTIKSSRDNVSNNDNYYTKFEKGPSIQLNSLNMKSKELTTYKNQDFMKSKQKINTTVGEIKEKETIQQTDLSSRFLNKDVIEQLRKNYPYKNQK